MSGVPMLPIPFAMAGAVEVLLVLAESIYPNALPIGGSHIAQFGFLFGGAFALCELASIMKRLFGSQDSGRRHKRGRI